MPARLRSRSAAGLKYLSQRVAKCPEMSRIHTGAGQGSGPGMVRERGDGPSRDRGVVRETRRGRITKSWEQNHAKQSVTRGVRETWPSCGRGTKGTKLTARYSVKRRRRVGTWITTDRACGDRAAPVSQGRLKIAQHLSAGWAHAGTASPGGTKEALPRVSFVPPGLTSVAAFNPALKCWAILLPFPGRTFHRRCLQEFEMRSRAFRFRLSL